MAADRRAVVLAIGLGVIILGLSGNALRLGINRREARSQQFAPADGQVSPYTVVYRERIYNSALPAEGQLTRGVYIVALRSDGSWLRWSEHRYEGINSLASQRWIYFSSGLQIQTNEARHLKSTVVQPPQFMDRRDPQADCRRVRRDGTVDNTEPVIGHDVVAGYKTAILRTRGNSTWRAPEAGCAQLRRRAVFPAGAYNEQTAVAVILGEPDGRLFSADEYDEVTASVLQNLSPGSAEAKRRDSYYSAHRPKQ